MVKKAAKLVVQGTVQGVFFRQFVKDNADDLKLKGFVRNLEDSNIEIVVEGEPEQIDRLIGFVKKGPGHAQIRGVKVEERKVGKGDFKEFKILGFDSFINMILLGVIWQINFFGLMLSRIG